MPLGLCLGGAPCSWWFLSCEVPTVRENDKACLKLSFAGSAMANATRKGDEGGGAKPPLHTIFGSKIGIWRDRRRLSDHAGVESIAVLPNRHSLRPWTRRRRELPGACDSRHAMGHWIRLMGTGRLDATAGSPASPANQSRARSC